MVGPVSQRIRKSNNKVAFAFKDVTGKWHRWDSAWREFYNELSAAMELGILEQVFWN